MSLLSVRHVPIFVHHRPRPLIAQEAAMWWTTWSAAGQQNIVRWNTQSNCHRRHVRFPAHEPLAGGCDIGAFPDRSAAPLAQGFFQSSRFPVKMVHAHQKEILASRVLTTDQWADYLIYTDPRTKVFVDGRSDFYGAEIGNQYLRMYSGNWDWNNLMKQYQFNLVLLPVESPLVQLLKITPEWRVEQDNGKEILLVHR